MNCKIISLEEKRGFADAKSVLLPGQYGQTEVLPGHAETFIRLGEGEIFVESGPGVAIPVPGGVCHVKNDEVNIVL